MELSLYAYLVQIVAIIQLAVKNRLIDNFYLLLTYCIKIKRTTTLKFLMLFADYVFNIWYESSLL